MGGINNTFTSLAFGSGLDGLRAIGNRSTSACQGTNVTASSSSIATSTLPARPPSVAFCFAGAARTFATPLMMENHHQMLVRPLTQEGDDSCAFVYLKLSDSPKVGSRVHFDAQRTELGAVLAALGDGGGTRDPWLGRMLAEAVVINGSGSFDGVGWRPAVDGGRSSTRAALAALREGNTTRAQLMRPKNAKCGSGGNFATTEVALALQWCAQAIGRHEAREGRRFDVVAYIRPDQLLLHPVFPWCEWKVAKETFTCLAGGLDGVAVMPRDHAAQVLGMLSMHTRCRDSDPVLHCQANRQWGQDHIAIVS